MNKGRSDASTSTDDVKGRPLCLFYFTHPFGVLSPEPPTLAAAPPDIARAFINMEPVSPFHFWTSSTEESYKTTSSVSTRPSYDLGKATVHKSPVNLVSVTKTRKCTVDFGSRRDSLASTLFSDIWFNSSSSSRSNDYARRVIPYNTILPPLELPNNVSELDGSDDMWPRKCLLPGKFSLPPIEMPNSKPSEASDLSEIPVEVESVRTESISTTREHRRQRRLGVSKHRRRRYSDVRRLLACLMRRAIRGDERHPSPALQRLLATIRDAWAEPTSLFYRCATLSRPPRRSPRSPRSPRAPHMLQRVQLAELPPRPDASPGLLRRRYSVPETIMRKYRVAQQRADCEESEPPSRCSVASLSPAGRSTWSPCAAPRFARDRELMRKSALLRRMWGRAPPPCCCCCRADLAPRHARSLDGSHSELRSRSRAGESRARAASSCIDTITDVFTDTDAWRSDERVATPPGERSSAAVTADMESEPGGVAERGPLSSSSSINPATALTQTGRPSYATDVPASYEMLEIVVSEILDTRGALAPSSDAPAPVPSSPRAVRAPAARLGTNIDDVNIDDYVSSVLVESLNSLTDRLECVTAAVGCDRKISVVEKEIKVKLQSTGVNTIVHLSPTSNNQIIFGNEELCDSGDRGSDERDASNNRRDTLTIRDEPLHDQRNNNGGSPHSLRSPPSPHSPRSPPSPRSPRSQPDRMRITEFDGGGGGGHNDNVNRAVLQQIQKLFQDEMHSLETDANLSGNTIPAISHIEISDVDVFIDNNTNTLDRENATRCADHLTVHHTDDAATTHAIGAVGAGNYFQVANDTVVVPRFSAFPHTDSMEVNTSSSDDAEMVGSDCTSLVDSLDDPNSPRSVMLRRTFANSCRRTELVRSAIDVLDLLPESAAGEHDTPPKDKGEAFFIRIKDNDCECDKENVNVADRMPEKIKQRLYRRHRRRQLRMECARRTKAKQIKREGDRQRHDESRARRLVERDCIAIISALIDDVIAKIAKDEYKVARIKRRSDRPSPTKSDENLTKKNRKKDLRSPTDDKNPERNTKREPDVPRATNEHEREILHEANEVHGKLSLVPRCTLPPEGRPKRLYQKSEIHEGNKCIEILEILEYVNGTHSTPETPPDESLGLHARSGRRSRIPVPVLHEKASKLNKTGMRNSSSDERVSPPFPRANNRHQCDSNANVLLSDIEHQRKEDTGEFTVVSGPAAARRASVPPVNEPRPRSDSLRFRRIFEIIPEERSSLSIDSSTDEVDRRRSSPALRQAAAAPPPAPTTRSVAISPLADVESKVTKCMATVASAAMCAGGPLRVKGGEGGARERARRPRVWPVLARRDEGSREKVDRTVRRNERQTRADGTVPSLVENGANGARASDTRAERKVNRSKSESRERKMNDIAAPTRSFNGAGFDRKSRRDERRLEYKRSEEESSRGAGRPTASPTEAEGTSSSGESTTSLLCPLAPRWLAGHARRRRRRTDHDQPGGWSVTVAGSCRAALPADVEMRLRFPRRDLREQRTAPAPAPHTHAAAMHQECRCRGWADCACSAPSERATVPPPLPPAPAPAHAPHHAHLAHLARPDGKLTLTVKKEARDSSILASKSSRRSMEPLPDLETYKSSRTKTKSSMKTRRGYSLHCWLPEDEPAPIRASNGLSVLGCAIIPELKPRVPTMSERDLTRLYTPRHYLRS